MADRIDYLFQEWHRLGGAVLLAESADAVVLRPVEEVIILEPFFLRVARSPLASRLARENSLEIFKHWNYYSNELRYLSG